MTEVAGGTIPGVLEEVRPQVGPEEHSSQVVDVREMVNHLRAYVHDMVTYV